MTPKDKWVTTVTSLFYLLYPTLCKQSFEMFNCRYIGGALGGRLVLLQDFDEVCYEKNHLTMVFLLGLSQLLLYVLALPLLLLYFLQRNQMRLEQTPVVARYGQFYVSFRPERYYWEAILSFRKVSVTMLSVLSLTIDVQNTMMLVMLLLLLCLGVDIAGQPYQVASERHEILKKTEAEILIVLWFTAWCSMLVYQLEKGADEWKRTLLSMVVVGVNLSLCVRLLVKYFAQVAWEKKDTTIGKKVDELRRSVRGRLSIAAAAVGSTSSSSNVLEMVPVGVRREEEEGEEEEHLSSTQVRIKQKNASLSFEENPLEVLENKNDDKKEEVVPRKNDVVSGSRIERRQLAMNKNKK